jgi:hypothetical protein
MMGPNEVLKSIVSGLAVLTATATVVLSSIAFRFRKKVLKAEKERFELKRMKAAQNRERIESFETHAEDHREALTR